MRLDWCRKLASGRHRNGWPRDTFSEKTISAITSSATRETRLERLGFGESAERTPSSSKLAIRERIEANIAESVLARDSSNFSKYSEWPLGDGFVLNASQRLTLLPGQVVDRFGSAQGRFAAERDTPYRARALKPGSDGAPYHVYEVILPLEVTAGPTRPWFGYEGGGTQFMFDDSIRVLLERGALREKK
jgi:hypothetical protein